MSLYNLTQELTINLEEGNLKIFRIFEYFQYITDNYEEIEEFEHYTDYKKSCALLEILLNGEEYVDDPDERQAIASVAYYILTKGLFNNIYDENRIGDIEYGDPHELINFLGARLRIMSYAPQSIKYSLTSSGSLPRNKFDTIYSSSNASDKILDNMLIYDAYLIKLNNPESFQLLVGSQNIQLSNEVLGYYNYFSEHQLNNILDEGYKNHRALFEYLERKFEIENNFDFS